MDERKLRKDLTLISYLTKTITILVIGLVTFVMLISTGSLEKIANKRKAAKQSVEVGSAIIDGVHVETGLVDSPGLQLVIQNCTSCHSSKLITQNRMNLAGWSSTIKWMQETQNLWDLGKSESVILEYLAANYSPTKKGRRQNLESIEWYELK